MATWDMCREISADMGDGLRLALVAVDGKPARPHLGRWATNSNGELDHRRWSGFLTVDELEALRAELNKLNMDELRTAITAEG